MQIYICDDELPILNNLTAKMQSLMPDENITSFSSTHELLQASHRLWGWCCICWRMHFGDLV